MNASDLSSDGELNAFYCMCAGFTTVYLRSKCMLGMLEIQQIDYYVFVLIFFSGIVIFSRMNSL